MCVECEGCARSPDQINESRSLACEINGLAAPCLSAPATCLVKNDVQTMAWTRSRDRALILHYRALPPQNARTHINPPFATRQRAQTVSQRCRPQLHSGRSIRPWIDRRFQFRSFRKRSEEHTSELQSLMRNSYAVFCLKKKKN